MLENYITVHTRVTITDNSDEPVPQDAKDVIKSSRKATIVNQLIMTVSRSKEMILQRAKFILNHFINEVMLKKTNDSFKPKAMIVCSSRSHVLWYKEIMDSIIREYDEYCENIHFVASFSPFNVDNKLITENDPAINGIYANSLVTAFQNPLSTVKFLIVCSKFLTGFDEPLVHTMYASCFFIFLHFFPSPLSSPLPSLFALPSPLPLFG